jgi:hypothetical protein
VCLSNSLPTVPSLNIIHTPVNLALSQLLYRPSSLTRALGLLTFTAIVFRAEIVLLLTPLTAIALYKRHMRMLDVFRIGVIYGVPSLGPLSSLLPIHETDDTMTHSFYRYD